MKLSHNSKEDTICTNTEERQECSKRRQCRDGNLNYKIKKYGGLTKDEYKYRYDWFGRAVQWELCNFSAFLSSIFQNILEKFRFYQRKRKTSQHLQGIRLGWKENLVGIVQMTGI